jgi:hypothetical protein
LPDWWELLKGLNPNSAPGDYSDANMDLVGDGYTELERYLNWLAQPHYDCPAGTSVNVELTQYTRGFTNNSPGYTVFGATTGTVVLNSRTAQFTPTVSTNALGSFMFKVADASGFAYTNTVGVHIIGAASNTPPVLAAISDSTVNVGINLSITNAASDADVPAQTLAFSLAAAPTNAAIGSSNGVISWRPLVAQANTTNPFRVVVTDSGTPSMSATQSFNVAVNPLTSPRISASSGAGRTLSLSVTGQAGPDYGILASSNLVDWQMLLVTNPSVLPFTWQATNVSLPQQFYRVKVGPPLP